MMKKEELIDFENDIIELYKKGYLPYVMHFCGGNEDELIKIFEKIKPNDYIFSDHRTHYHYLLAGGSKEKLKDDIMRGKSMFVFDKKLNFLSTSIVAGGPCIAAGMAMGIKLKGDDRHVWCFIGDGAEDEGHFYEAVRYVDGHDLPCTFIIEDNNRNVDTPKIERYGKNAMNWPSCVIRYHYEPIYPHCSVPMKEWLKFKMYE